MDKKTERRLLARFRTKLRRIPVAVPPRGTTDLAKYIEAFNIYNNRKS